MSARMNTAKIHKLRAVDQGNDASDVRRFLASLKLVDSTHPIEVYRGRALLEWYASVVDGAPAPCEADTTLTVRDCVDLLEFLASVHSVTPDDCYSHSQAAAA